MKTALLSLLSLVGLSLAVPVEIDARDSVGVPEDVFQNLKLFSQYAAATYCTNNNDSPNSKITCGANACPMVEAANTTSIIEFQHTLITDDTGYVAIDQTRQLIVVAFRGTQAIQNFIDDNAFIKLPFLEMCLTCLVHRGFLNSWLEIRDQVLGAVSSAKSQHPTFELVVVGHSLGGAIASLAAAELRKEGNTAALYTYGSPRVGNAPFADLVTDQAGGNYRVTHTDDIVPRLPPISFDYAHISPEYHIEQGDTNINASNINLYTGPINIGGNLGELTFSAVAHLYYFANIGACSPGIGIY
ncbi:MAG: hypothetical protein M1838_002145 [Thelocarpon superellum]|nr:MAG: hypothetical protein M1838_002145 [Thelocarpon superellum]